MAWVAAPPHCLLIRGQPGGHCPTQVPAVSQDTTATISLAQWDTPVHINGLQHSAKDFERGCAYTHMDG